MTRPSRDELQLHVRRLVVDPAALGTGDFDAEAFPLALQAALQRRADGSAGMAPARSLPAVERVADAVWSQVRASAGGAP